MTKRNNLGRIRITAMIILIILLLISFLHLHQPVMALPLPTGSTPLILVTPSQTREQKQLYAVEQFFPKIKEIHSRMESRIVKMKNEGMITSRIESDLSKNDNQISTIEQTIAGLNTQINFGTPSASATQTIGTQLRNVISKLKSIYLLQKQIIVNMKKLTPVINKTEPTMATTGGTNP